MNGNRIPKGFRKQEVVTLGSWRRAWRNRVNGEEDTKYEEHWLEATENVKGFALSLRAVANDVRKY